jgi:hypothetical protein
MMHRNIIASKFKFGISIANLINDVITSPMRNTVFDEYLKASVMNANVILEIISATLMIKLHIKA